MVQSISPSRKRRRQRKQVEGDLRNRYYRQSGSIRKRIVEIEAELSRLEGQLREVEQRFSDQEHYGDSGRVVETIGEHRQLKEAIEQLTAEWERLSAEAVQMTQEFT